MNDPILPLCIGLIMVVVLQLMDKWQLEKGHKSEVDRLHDAMDENHVLLDNALDRMEEEREHWRVERQKLLDRIQAPSFGEYKQAEVKTIRAQNGEKEPPKLVQL